MALAALAGLALAVALIGNQGFGAVIDALLSTGQWGLVLVTLFHLIPMTFSALAWRSLLNATWQGPVSLFVWGRWIRNGVNNLLPVAQIGGGVIAARILTFRGATAPIAGASVAVDLTVEVITQFLFTLLGLGLLVLSGYQEDTASWVIIGMTIAAVALIGFVFAQRLGLFMLIEWFLERLAEKFAWPSFGQITGLHDAVRALYRDSRGLFASGFFHLLSWILGAGEIWLALYFMDSSVGFGEALILESLGQAIRSAAFAVPGALGVQEGGYLLLGGLFGLSPEVALALSLIKRVREIVLGLPALVAWQRLEWQHVWGKLRGTRGNINES